MILDDIYSRENFQKIVGRKKRNNNWQEVQDFFDKYFKPEFDWRKKCKWQEKMIESNRKQFDISFGYACEVYIPYEKFQNIDVNTDNLSSLGFFIDEVKTEMESIV